MIVMDGRYLLARAGRAAAADSVQDRITAVRVHPVMSGDETYERYKRGYKRKFGYFSLKNTQPSSLSLLYLSYVRK